MRSYPLPASSAVVGPGVAASGSLVGLRGLVVVESATTAAAAYVTVREGTSTGNILMAVKIAGSGMFDTTFNEAIMSNGQLYVKYESGTVTGAVRID